MHIYILMWYDHVARVLFLSIQKIKLEWLRGTMVERQSLTGELLLSCARPAADIKVSPGQPLGTSNLQTLKRSKI